ncbi:MAG: DUF4215 domain-containing protein [Candidatus Woesearchaeota archaeon]
MSLFLIFITSFTLAFSCSGSCESGSECNAAGDPSEGKMWSCRKVNGAFQCVQEEINAGGSSCYLDCQSGWQPCGCDEQGCVERCLRDNAGKPGHHTRTEECSNCGQKFTCGCNIPEQPKPYCGDSICNDGSSKTCEPNGPTKDMKCVNNVYTGDLANGVCRTSGDFACTYCGDGILQRDAGEMCDDGNNIDNDQCNNNCRFNVVINYCGDSICNDGSSKTCEPNGEETDFICTNNQFMGYLNEGKCRTTAEFDLYACTYCGDGIVQEGAGEECDDGNDIDDDECSNSCKFYYVPEFSTITFGFAILVSGIGLLYMRKRR